MGRYTGKKCRLMAMFSLTASFFVVEIVVGHITNSMALIADSFHMLSDIAALVIAFISVKMAPTIFPPRLEMLTLVLCAESNSRETLARAASTSRSICSFCSTSMRA